MKFKQWLLEHGTELNLPTGGGSVRTTATIGNGPNIPMKGNYGIEKLAPAIEMQKQLLNKIYWTNAKASENQPEKMTAVQAIERLQQASKNDPVGVVGHNRTEQTVQATQQAIKSVEGAWDYDKLSAASQAHTNAQQKHHREWPNCYPKKISRDETPISRPDLAVCHHVLLQFHSEMDSQLRDLMQDKAKEKEKFPFKPEQSPAL